MEMISPSPELSFTDYYFMHSNHLIRQQKEITKLIGNKPLSPRIADKIEDIEKKHENLVILPIQIFFWAYRSN
jgi:hypothetical protein